MKKIVIKLENNLLTIDDEWKFLLKQKDLRTRNIHKKNFSFNVEDFDYDEIVKLVEKFKLAIESNGYEWVEDSSLISYLENKLKYDTKENYSSILNQLIDFKESNILSSEKNKLWNEFLDWVHSIEISSNRKFKDYQIKNAFHVILGEKTFNFSVPGSGKTSTTLLAFAFLKYKSMCDKLIIVGPINSYMSWSDELTQVFDKDETIWFSKKTTQLFKKIDFFFFNYESLERRKNDIEKILNENKTFVVFDESHKIKNPDAKRTNLSLKIFKKSKYILFLTGTPVPNSFLDIYPSLQMVVGEKEYNSFFGWTEYQLKNNTIDPKIINKRINPLFVRVSKEDLKLPPTFDNVINVDLTENEICLLRELKRYFRNKSNFALIIRSLQALTNPKLLLSSLNREEYSDEDIDDSYLEEVRDDKISRLIESIDYSSKTKFIVNFIYNIVSQGKNILVWTIFKDNMHLIIGLLKKLGINSVDFINGTVNNDKREEIIRSFQNGKLKVLIANPQTLAESASLHRNCHDAIYLDLSFNLVHLLQSKDRIHRIGLDNDIKTNYYYLIGHYEKSIDQIIYNRLVEKNQAMLDILNSNEVSIELSKEGYENEELDILAKEYL